MNEVSVERFGPGEGLLTTQPGDFVLTHRKAFPSFMIALGQRIRFRKGRKPFAHWSHAALIVGYHGELIEALAPGLVCDNLSRYKGVEYHYVTTDLDERDRERVRRYGVTMARRHTLYDYLEIVSLGLQLLTGATVTFTTGSHTICSGFVATALERTDAIFTRAANTMLPADLAEYYGVVPLPDLAGGPPPPPTQRGPASPPVPPAHRVYS